LSKNPRQQKFPVKILGKKKDHGPNHYWNRVEWTREMVPNTYHHSNSCLDKKIAIDSKNFKITFSLPISLTATLKLCLRNVFQQKNIYPD